MDNLLRISGFKCFDRNTPFNLKSLTAVTGSNGTGKSSFIQSLLLIRLAIEKNARIASQKDYTGKDWPDFPVPLNKQYELALGTAFDIFNEVGLDSDNQISFALDGEEFVIPLPDERGNDRAIKITLKEPFFDEQQIPFWRRNEFYYLNTERLGPRHFLQSNYTEFLSVGCKGEYTAQVISDVGVTFKVDSTRYFESTKGETLLIQVNAWLNYVCPGVSIKVEALGSMSAKVLLRNGSSPKDTSATNMGFGVSYALPIIVTGLIAETGCAFIVENPEAHLHPKGQSNMGYFLGKIAMAGVKVVIETHSEHVINGIRRAVLSVPDFARDDVSFYFFNDFSKKSDRIKEITLDEKGNLSDFPVDFFDQARQDLLEIMKLGKA